MVLPKDPDTCHQRYPARSGLLPDYVRLGLGHEISATAYTSSCAVVGFCDFAVESSVSAATLCSPCGTCRDSLGSHNYRQLRSFYRLATTFQYMEASFCYSFTLRFSYRRNERWFGTTPTYSPKLSNSCLFLVRRPPPTGRGTIDYVPRL